jgi:methylenetetrahydrofolate reductase (NADPH)
MPSSLRETIAAGRFAVTVEFNPPKGADMSGALTRLARLRGRVDAVNVTDSPMAKARMSSVACSAVIERGTGLETVFNLTCRDRNLIALHADLLGAHALGLRNVLCITGDPPSLGDWKNVKGVFEFPSTGLLSLVASLNAGKDGSGRGIAGPTDLFPGAVCCPAAPSLAAEVREAGRKKAAGARFFMTQPVFETESARRFLSALGPDGSLPVIFGIMPLKSAAFARYLHESVPGITVPEEVLARMEAAPEGRGQVEEGTAAAANVARELRSFAAGVHIMPTGPPESIDDVLRAVGR